MHLSVLPTIAEHAGTDLLSKSLTQELKAAEWKTPVRPASPNSILERAESDSPSSSATSDKSEDLEVEQQDSAEEMEEVDLVSPTSPLPGFEAPSAKAQAKSPIWCPAPVSVRPFCPEFWSSFSSPTKPSPSVWASLDSPSSQPAGIWTTLPSPKQEKLAERSASPEPLPLSPISSPSSPPPPTFSASIYTSVPNNAPISRSMQAGRVPVLEREFSFKLGVTAAEPLPAASAKHFTRSLSLGAAEAVRAHPLAAVKAKQALHSDANRRPASAERALGKLSSSLPSPNFFPSNRKPPSPGTSPVVSPRSQGGSFSQGGPPPRKHQWCWRCGQRGDLATTCLVCTGDFAVCGGCAHERAAKGRRPDTCLCGGCMSRPIDPAVIERIQRMSRSSSFVGKQTGLGGPPNGSGQRGGGALIPAQHAGGALIPAQHAGGVRSR
ncbi:hypothetical protein KFL_001520130 [Klebsormidium nitens]|uniref:Uncharacterized protein n=1 Tax=Klebsormidium nitens TaxID=105231 RepID=A0A1Y1HZD3_KLENI|nr:hypothetical protein KFL_001520130 [Klebsormidium nitens]|eukprot:GAQ83543.1 hypothetical protein KFL_001520130 [Klebsormidium nitens]